MIIEGAGCDAQPNALFIFCLKITQAYRHNIYPKLRTFNPVISYKCETQYE